MYSLKRSHNTALGNVLCLPVGLRPRVDQHISNSRTKWANQHKNFSFNLSTIIT